MRQHLAHAQFVAAVANGNKGNFLFPLRGRHYQVMQGCNKAGRGHVQTPHGIAMSIGGRTGAFTGNEQVAVGGQLVQAGLVRGGEWLLVVGGGKGRKFNRCRDCR